MRFESDWHVFGTPTQLEEKLVSFQFKGEGWYYSGEDALLCMKVPQHKNVYVVHVYNSEAEIRENFEKISKLPVMDTHTTSGE